jgi:chromosome segregation ATPase
MRKLCVHLFLFVVGSLPNTLALPEFDTFRLMDGHQEVTSLGSSAENSFTHEVITGLFKIQATGKCMVARNRQEEGTPIIWDSCDKTNKDMIFDFDTKTEQIRNHYGICVEASSNQTGASITMSHCNIHQQEQQWLYNPTTGQIKLSSSLHESGSCLGAVNGNVGLALCETAHSSQNWDVEFTSENGQSVDCTVTDWTDFTKCTKVCGSGVQKRLRVIIKPAENGGSTCPRLLETRACGTRPCPDAKGCEVSAWSPFSACSQICGGGTQIRSRNILVQPAVLGTPCPGLSETRDCNSQDCVVKYEANEESSQNVWPRPEGDTLHLPKAADLLKDNKQLKQELHHRDMRLVKSGSKIEELQNKIVAMHEKLDKLLSGEMVQQCEEQVLALARVTARKDYLTSRLQDTEATLAKVREGNDETNELLNNVLKQKEQLARELATSNDKLAQKRYVVNSTEPEARVADLIEDIDGLKVQEQAVRTELNETRSKYKAKAKLLALCGAEKATLRSKLSHATGNQKLVSSSIQTAEKNQEVLKSRAQAQEVALQNRLSDASHKITVATNAEQQQSELLADCRSDKDTLGTQVQECQDKIENLIKINKEKSGRLETCMIAKGALSADVEAAQLKLETTAESPQPDRDVTSASLGELL